MKNLAFKKREKLRSKNRNGNENSELINLDSVTVAKTKDPPKWVYNLTIADEKVLLNGEWLNDRIMNACQELIRGKYPNMLGLQDVTCGHALSYEVQTGEFIQIIHTGRGHWVTLSTIGCDNAELHVFDSITPVVSSCLNKQVASLLCSKADIITLRYVELCAI